MKNKKIENIAILGMVMLLLAWACPSGWNVLAPIAGVLLITWAVLRLSIDLKSIISSLRQGHE